MEKSIKEIKLENNILDLAHEIVVIFFPELSEGSWVFKQKKERIINTIKKSDIISELFG